MVFVGYLVFFFFKQKTAYEMRISDWSSDVCSSDLWAGWRCVRRCCRPRRCASSTWRWRCCCWRRWCRCWLETATEARRHGEEKLRSEERRVGKECVSKCRSRWSPTHIKKNNTSTLRQHILYHVIYIISTTTI